MLSLSYQISPNLRVAIDRFEHTQQKILTTALPRQTELEYVWRSKLLRSFFSLKISGNSLKKHEMVKLISKGKVKSKKLSDDQIEAINYTQAQDYINYNWYISGKQVTPEVVYRLFYVACQPTHGDSMKKFDSKSAEVRSFLEYIQAGEEHPIIQAGIAQIQLRILSPFKNCNGRITRLLAQLLLYKYGFESRGVIVPDEYWYKNFDTYRQEVEVAVKSHNVTAWLEFYADGLANQADKALEGIREGRKVVALSSSFWALTARQKEIMAILENPEVNVTNYDVQKRFKVSQITASRDLAKLTTLGVIFRHGKGRSVYYTRV